MKDRKDIILSYVNQINDYYQNIAGIDIQPFPKVLLDETPNDENELQIRTGQYVPKHMEIDLFIGNRQLKDILRTYCHELLHHSQNIKNPEMFEKMFKGGTLEENPKLKTVEGNAYLNGNLAFRMFTEWLKTNKERNIDMKVAKKVKKTIQPYSLARSAADFMNESAVAPGMATGGDINSQHNKIDEEAARYIETEGWLKAFLLASSILLKGASTFARIEDIRDIGAQMYDLGTDIENMMFKLAKAGRLPKEGYNKAN